MPITVRGVTRASLVEVLVLGVAVALAAPVIMLVPGAGPLAADLAVVAAGLLGAAACVARNTRSRLVAFAVALYVAVPLLLRGAPGSTEPFWLLAASIAALGSVAMLALSLRAAPRRRDRAPQVLAATVAVAVLAVLVVSAVAPTAAPPAWLVLGAGMIAWSGAGATGLLVIAAGVQHDRPLPRSVGLAFVTLAVAHAMSLVTGTATGAIEGSAARILELGATAMLVVTGARHLAAGLREVRERLAAADAALCAAADREELRAAVDGPSTGAAVGPLLRDLAVVHRSSGLAVEVDVEPDLRVGMDHWALGQAITNLLVNCERHAPGARVWLRARRHADLARLEVADDGPGLPGGAPDVLREGAHGLAATAEIVGRYGGTFTVTSADGGCVATLELPVQRSRVRP